MYSMIKWSLEEINLNLKYDWAISRGKLNQKTVFLITCESEDCKGRGEVSPNMRYGESPEETRRIFEEFQLSAQSATFSLQGLDDVLNFFEEFEETSGIDLPHSLKFGLESSYIDLLSKLSEKPIGDLVGARPGQGVPTLYSVPLMESEKLAKFYRDHNLQRFSDLKCKVDGSTQSKECLRSLFELHEGKIAVDANEGFEDIESLEAFLQGLPLDRFLFLEQPFPVSCSHLGRELRKSHPEIFIMADESLTDGRVYDEMVKDFHAVNIKLMKTGSLLKGLRQIREARALGMKVMIGCMVETSIGISHALQLSKEADWLDLDGFMYFQDEPFKEVYESEGKLYFGSSQ